MINTDGQNTTYTLSGGYKLTLTGSTHSLKGTDDDALTVAMTGAATGLNFRGSYPRYSNNYWFYGNYYC